ncbi:MAG: hypothetical protein HYT14_01180 [Candidatus Liptonbacteria bacterium]|nr:hypothetical protein [Candidatus Liptonbacteria bacterium]
MNSKQFLLWGGSILVLLAIAGWTFLGEGGVGGDFFWLDGAENWAHLVLGVVAIAAAYLLGEDMQKWLVYLVGVLGVLVAFWGFFVGADLYGAHLEASDNILHLVVGVWALWAAWNTKKAMMM